MCVLEASIEFTYLCKWLSYGKEMHFSRIYRHPNVHHFDVTVSFLQVFVLLVE